MKRELYLCLVIGMMSGSACENVEYVRGDDEGTTPITWVNPLYAAAVAFPEGYDWRRDSLGGNVHTEILFFKDAVKMMQVNAMSENEVSANPDMHRIIDGHLYTDYSSTTHTILKKDGVELLRYTPGEIIKSLVVRDTCTYTLGIPRGQSGWALRRNGEVIHSSGTGKLLSNLHWDSDSLCFGAAVPIEGIGSQEAAWRYWIIRSGTAQLLRLEESDAQVLAVRSFRGQTNLLVSLGSGRLIWKTGEQEIILCQENSVPWRNCFFLMAGDKLYAHVQLKLAPNLWTDMFYSEDKEAVHSHSRHEVYSVCEDAPCLCFASIPTGGYSPVMVTFDDDSCLFPDGYRMISPFALATDGKKYAVGLNDTRDNYRPMLVRGKDTVRFDFNGYFTRLYLP